MTLPKNCELCGKVYECRADKISSSRFCSVRCRSINGGKASWIKCQENWKKDSKEEFMLKMKNSFESFFEKGSEIKCWLWKQKMGKASSDYGSFTFRGIGYKSNRVAWMIFRGEIPKDTYVLHTCDVRNCVNPNHLFLGTHADNMHDMAQKKRAKPRCKLSEEQVSEVRRLLALGVTTVRIAKDYGVTSTCIWYIKHNKSWNK